MFNKRLLLIALLALASFPVFAQDPPVPPPEAPPSSAVVPLPDVPDDLRELAEQTRDSDWWLRKVAIVQLAETGRPEVVPLLIAGLKDPSSKVQKASVEALGTLRDPRAAKHLVAALKDEDVQRDIIDALVRYPQEQTLPLLRLALEEPSMYEGAARALAKINTPEAAAALFEGPAPVSFISGFNPEYAAAALTNALQAADVERKKRILVGLQREQAKGPAPAGQQNNKDSILHPAMVQALVAATQDGDDGVRVQATRTLTSWMLVDMSNQGKVDSAVTQRVLQLTHDKTAAVRYPAITAIGKAMRFEQEQGRAIPAEWVEPVVGALRDPNLGIGLRAAALLDSIQWEPKTPEDATWYKVVAQNTTHAVVEMGAPAEPLLEAGNPEDAALKIPVLIHALTAEKKLETAYDRQEYIQTPRDVFVAIIQLKEPRFAEPLGRLAASEDKEEAELAISTLGQMAIPEAIPPLLAALENPAMADTAMEALINYSDPRVTQALTAKLDAPNRDIRYLAAVTLGKQKAADAVPALAAKLTTPDPHLRKIVVGSLGKIGTDEAVAALDQALQSPRLAIDAKREILSALAVCENPKGIEVVKRTFADGPDELRGPAAYALLEAGTEEAKKFVAENYDKARELFDKAVKDNSPRIRDLSDKARGQLERLRRNLNSAQEK